MPVPINHTCNEIIERQLDIRARALESITNGDVLILISALARLVDDRIQEAIEGRPRKHSKLVVVLETPGGYNNVVERIAHTFRQHYKRVDFVVPNYAMSAGTVLVMSGNAIYMNYYAQLGPIDPQLAREDGRFTPALGYLIQYDRLVEKAQLGTMTQAELAYFIQNFDPADLYNYEQERELGKALVRDWLLKYKLAQWKRTRTRNRKVTRAMRRRCAEKAASVLSEPEEWHSHGRRIPIAAIRRKLKLQVINFGIKKKLNGGIMGYYRLMTDYIRRRGHTGALHIVGHYEGIY